VDLKTKIAQKKKKKKEKGRRDRLERA